MAIAMLHVLVAAQFNYEKKSCGETAGARAEKNLISDHSFLRFARAICHFSFGKKLGPLEFGVSLPRVHEEFTRGFLQSTQGAIQQ